MSTVVKHVTAVGDDQDWKKAVKERLDELQKQIDDLKQRTS